MQVAMGISCFSQKYLQLLLHFYKLSQTRTPNVQGIVSTNMPKELLPLPCYMTQAKNVFWLKITIAGQNAVRKKKKWLVLLFPLMT